LWLGKATYYVVRRDVSSDALAGCRVKASVAF
jgi:hypothetical protein